jgi:hypothetical protein
VAELTLDNRALKDCSHLNYADECELIAISLIKAAAETYRNGSSQPSEHPAEPRQTRLLSTYSEPQ